MKLKTAVTKTSELLFIVDVARSIREDFRKRAEHLKLSQAQWRILLCLFRSPGIAQSKLAEILEVSPVTISQSIERLVKAGWVKKESSTRDKRGFELKLTAHAGPIVKELNDIAEKMHKELFDGFTASEKTEIETLMLKLKKNIELHAIKNDK